MALIRLMEEVIPSTWLIFSISSMGGCRETGRVPDMPLLLAWVADGFGRGRA